MNFKRLKCPVELSCSLSAVWEIASVTILFIPSTLTPPHTPVLYHQSSYLFLFNLDKLWLIFQFINSFCMLYVVKLISKVRYLLFLVFYNFNSLPKLKIFFWVLFEMEPRSSYLLSKHSTLGSCQKPFKNLYFETQADLKFAIFLLQPLK